jgi:3-dehydroquinate dehydratase/shikimate dehydrogenase
MSVFGTGVRRVCGVVAAETSEEARKQIAQALRHTPTVEIRLDWMWSDRERRRFLDWLQRARASGSLRTAQLIVTCRRVEGGGRFRGSVEAELKWLADGVRAGCEWCDLEIETARRLPKTALAEHGVTGKILLSEHHFERTRGTFRVLAMAGDFAAVKIAAQAKGVGDSVRVLRLAHSSRGTRVAVAMGEAGLPARVLALREGSALAYAAVAAKTAPGQIPLDDFVESYRAHELTRQTRVYGVIGDPVGHSLSPLMHNTGFAAASVDAVYLPFLVSRLPDFLRAVPDFGVCGFSVTIPHKQAILRYLADCEAMAAEIGAVNTVVVSGGKLKGFNTDHLGVLRALEPKMKLRGSRVLILGAGGAARAAAFAVSRSGAEVLVCARREIAAKELAKLVGGGAIARRLLVRMRFDAIINATPVGMHPYSDVSPLAARELNCDVVMDLIYRPIETKLLKIAARLGRVAVSGIEMFLAQGFAQWELWNKSNPPEVPMRRAVLRALQSEPSE